MTDLYVSLGCFFFVEAGPGPVRSLLEAYVVYLEKGGNTKATNEWGGW